MARPSFLTEATEPMPFFWLTYRHSDGPPAGVARRRGRPPRKSSKDGTHGAASPAPPLHRPADGPSSRSLDKRSSLGNQIRPSRLVFRTLVPRIGNENRPTGNDHARRPASAHRNPAPPSRAAVALEPTTARHRVARPGRTGGPDGARRGFKTAHRSQRRGRRAAGAARPLRQRPQ